MKEWLVSIALTKGLKKIVQLGIAYILTLPLDAVGVTIDERLATAAAFGGLEVFRNFLKVKFGLSFL